MCRVTTGRKVKLSGPCHPSSKTKLRIHILNIRDRQTILTQRILKPCKVFLNDILFNEKSVPEIRKFFCKSEFAPLRWNSNFSMTSHLVLTYKVVAFHGWLGFFVENAFYLSIKFAMKLLTGSTTEYIHPWARLTSMEPIHPRDRVRHTGHTSSQPSWASIKITSRSGYLYVNYLKGLMEVCWSHWTQCRVRNHSSLLANNTRFWKNDLPAAPICSTTISSIISTISQPLFIQNSTTHKISSHKIQTP